VITCSIACATEIDDGNNDELDELVVFSSGGIILV
jgi:hypothetical protein